MQHRFLLWRDKLLLLTLLAFFYDSSTYIRVAIRAILEGREFQWAYYSGVKVNGAVAYTSGEGIYGDAQYILVCAFLVGWLLCAGLRRPDGFFRTALLGWMTIGLAISLWLTVHSQGNLTVGKETLGLTLSHIWVDVLPGILAWALALALFVRGLVRGSNYMAPDWTRLNSILLGAGAVLLVVSAVLLNLGSQHGWADFNGIGMIYVATFLFLAGVAPWERKGAAAAPPNS